MNEETGTMTLLEITRMIEYLHQCGLTYEQIYCCIRYMATGIRSS